MGGRRPAPAAGRRRPAGGHGRGLGAASGEREADERLADDGPRRGARTEGLPVSTPSTRFDFSAPVPEATTLGRVHFIAIGGAGMSGVARVMLARGMAGHRLGRQGLPGPARPRGRGRRRPRRPRPGPRRRRGHGGHLLGHPRVQRRARQARANGLRVLHRSQALAALMQDSRRVAVAGANGKTTTTSMLTVALQACGVDPSFAVGGELARHGTNAHHGTGDVFVAEADESDGSFLVYRPEVAIVTNVQPDHLDFYGTFEAVQDAYARFARTVLPGGLLVTCADDEGVACPRRRRPRRRRARAQLRLPRRRRRAAPGGRRLRPDLVGRAAPGRGAGAPPADRHPRTAQPAQRHRRVPGRHRPVSARTRSGCSRASPAFTGTRRRFELKGEVDGVRVVDDYAHNPGKVAAVVETGARARGARPPRRGVPAAPVLAHPRLRRRPGGCPLARRRGRRHGRLRRAGGPRARGQRRPGRRPRRRPRRDALRPVVVAGRADGGAGSYDPATSSSPSAPVTSPWSVPRSCACSRRPAAQDGRAARRTARPGRRPRAVSGGPAARHRRARRMSRPSWAPTGAAATRVPAAAADPSGWPPPARGSPRARPPCDAVRGCLRPGALAVVAVLVGGPLAGRDEPGARGPHGPGRGRTGRRRRGHPAPGRGPRRHPAGARWTPTPSHSG